MYLGIKYNDASGFVLGYRLHSLLGLLCFCIHFRIFFVCLFLFHFLEECLSAFDGKFAFANE